MGNRTFAHFLCDGVEGMGSDAWYILDGRNRLEVHCRDARERMYALRQVQSYNGFQIREGERLDNSRVVYVELDSTVNDQYLIPPPNDRRLAEQVELTVAGADRAAYLEWLAGLPFSRRISPRERRDGVGDKLK